MHWKKIWKAGVIDHQFMAKCESQRSSLEAKRLSLLVRGQKKKQAQAQNLIIKVAEL